MSAKLRICHLLVIPLVLVLGCSDPLGPTDVAGLFELKQIDGAALPTNVTVEGRTYVYMFGTIELHADGAAWITGHWVEAGSMGLGDQWGYEMPYELRGRELRWQYADCLGICNIGPRPPTFSVYGDLLVAQGGLRELYRRQPADN